MNTISFIAANALLFASLILVVGVPLLFASDTESYGSRSRNIRLIENGCGIWFHILLVNGLISEYVAHQLVGVSF